MYSPLVIDLWPWCCSTKGIVFFSFLFWASLHHGVKLLIFVVVDFPFFFFPVALFPSNEVSFFGSILFLFWSKDHMTLYPMKEMTNIILLLELLLNCIQQANPCTSNSQTLMALVIKEHISSLRGQAALSMTQGYKYTSLQGNSLFSSVA